MTSIIGITSSRLLDLSGDAFWSALKLVPRVSGCSCISLSGIPVFGTTRRRCSWNITTFVNLQTAVVKAMGNSATKEQRHSTNSRPTDQRRASSPGTSTAALFQSTEPFAHPLYSSRHGRSSRSEIASTLGIGSVLERDTAGLENRRETKQEREARRMQREKVNRERERERSMREENVDGGFLVTQGVYTGIEDYNKTIVRQLMVRKLLNHHKNLSDHFAD